MKKLFTQFPFLSRITLAFFLGTAALVLSGVVYGITAVKIYFPFVAETLLVLVTLFLYRTEKQKLPEIGLHLSRRNTGYLLLGLGIGVAAFFVATWLRTLYTGEVFHVGSAPDATSLLKSFYYILPAVMVQELMFRGYLFAKTIQRSGVMWANVLFATLFMLVHVLDRQVLQNPGQLIMLAVCIPIGHLWFATAFLRSKTILFPIGLHWGNNWVVAHLFGAADNRQTIFYLTDEKVFNTWPSFVVMLLIFNGFFLLVTWATWKAGLPFGRKQSTGVFPLPKI